jgi:FtsP/CotA-like multicopper oxidase with cupredoxin domain
MQERTLPLWWDHMAVKRLFAPTRRAVAAGIAATLVYRPGTAGSQPASGSSQPITPQGDAWRTLVAAPTKVRLLPEPAPETDVWAFDGRVPGPVIRVRHGDEVRVRLVNQTERPLALHWHGVRNANIMDGVGGLTQEPVAPGKSFDCRFTPPDHGTFLVRPLVVGGSSELAERGLSALLIVDEREPPKVDQDIALVIDDWRLAEDGALAPFGTLAEASTSGRLGNRLTINAKGAPEAIEVAPGSRIRLRLANACNARSMRIRFDDMKVYVAAIDGQPTDTFEPLRSTLPFSPGSRYDLMLDVPSEARSAGSIVALLGQAQQGTPLVTLAASGERLSRPALPPIAPLPGNKLLPPEVRLQNAVRRDVAISGGAIRGPDGAHAFKGDPARIWTINGASGAPGSSPLLSVKRGSPVVLAITNQTPTNQPIHLHGHVFRLLHPRDDGWEPYWLDTLQIPENKTVQIAFIADNPGKWALSSTVLERFDTGLWTWFEVT